MPRLAKPEQAALRNQVTVCGRKQRLQLERRDEKRVRPPCYPAIAQAENKAYDRKKALFATHEDISNDLVVAEEYGYVYGTTDLDVNCPVIEKFAKGIK